MARMEIIWGGDRRRRWTDEEKLRVLEEADRPGVRLSHVARSYDALPQQIRRWRRQLFGDVAVEPEVPTFVPVTVTDVALPVPSHCATRSAKPKPVMIEISLRNGRMLKVAADLDRHVLASLIACVEAA